MTTDTLDSLQQRWAAQDRKLDQAIALNTRVLREIELGKADGPLARLRWTLWIELALDVVVVVLLGSILPGDLREPAFAASVGILFLAALAELASTVLQLERLSQVDFAEPVLMIQRKLAALRRTRIRVVQAVVLFSPLLWVPLYLMFFGLVGADPDAFVGTKMYYANLAFGLAWMAGAAWVARRFGDRLVSTPFGREIVRDVGGSSLREVTERVDAIAAFERE